MIKDQTKQWQNKTEKEPCANKKNEKTIENTLKHINILIDWYEQTMAFEDCPYSAWVKIFLCWEEEIVHMNILTF